MSYYVQYCCTVLCTCNTWSLLDLDNSQDMHAPAVAVQPVHLIMTCGNAMRNDMHHAMSRVLSAERTAPVAHSFKAGGRELLHGKQASYTS